MRATRSKVELYARRVADLMGLRDWRIDVIDSLPPPDAGACVNAVYGRKFAQIEIAESTLDATRSQIRYYVVHELVHCHFGALHHYLDSILSKGERTAYNIPFEYGIDAVASAIAERMPMPTFGRIA